MLQSHARQAQPSSTQPYPTFPYPILPYPTLPQPTLHHPNPTKPMGCAQYSTSEKLWIQVIKFNNELYITYLNMLGTLWNILETYWIIVDNLIISDWPKEHNFGKVNISTQLAAQNIKLQALLS